jgi:hypothetical protein
MKRKNQPKRNPTTRELLRAVAESLQKASRRADDALEAAQRACDAMAGALAVLAAAINSTRRVKP